VKICQVLAGDEEGGLEKHFVELCNELVKYDEVYVIAHQKYKTRFDSKVKFISMDLSKSRKNPFVLWQLLQTIKQISPDIIHSHANKASSMISYIRYFLPSHIKRVASLHSQKKNISAFETFDYVIGVSKSSLINLNNPNKTAIYNGIDFTEVSKDRVFIDSEFGLKDKFVVTAVGRLEEVKNFALLIDAIKDLDICLMIVGEGSLESELKEQVNRLDISDKVIFTGYRDDALKIVANSDLFVISSNKEGLPYVLIEALLSKVPVVSTDVSDMKYILPKEYIVPIQDKKSLIQVISKVVQNYDKSLKDFQDSFEFAKDNFTLNSMVQKVIDVYKRVKDI